MLDCALHCFFLIYSYSFYEATLLLVHTCMYVFMFIYLFTYLFNFAFQLLV